MRTSFPESARGHEWNQALKRMFLCVETPGDFRKIFRRVGQSDEFMLRHADTIHLGDATDREVETFVDAFELGGIRHLSKKRQRCDPAVSDAVVAFVIQRHPRIIGPRVDHP